ncbi:MFS transporter [Antribacter sp. KLBMP9083]|uniref:MFS transporter n=1 Tax=Antribacter soli TaxID=2910976 RepID=A0AA41QC54_9MICO|nr:MFS transporter [Antribacter soli]MCF4120738.1 MFS transporter [Antribacter soli]
MTAPSGASADVDASREPGRVVRLGEGAQRIVLIGMVALCALGAFEALAVSTAMPTVAVDLGGLRHYTLAFSVTFGASIVGLLAAGRWCDRSGPTPAMWTGVALFVGGLVVAGLAPGMGVLIAGRALMGVGSGLYSVATYVLVARVFPAERHPRVFSAFAAAWVLPAIVGPALAGLVVENLGWRWVFLAVPALAVPAVLLLRPGLAAARGDGGAPSGVGQTTGSDPREDDAGGRARALRLALAVVRARRGLPAVITVRALISAAFVGAEVLLPLVLVHERGLTSGLAGVVLTVGALGWSTASWARGRDLLHLSHAGYVRVGGGLLAAGMLGAGVLALPGMPVAFGMASWVLSGLGMGLVFPTLSILTLELAETHEQGAASSALQVADALAGAAASAATGALLWSLHDLVGLPAYAACFGLTAALAAGVVALAGRTRSVAAA